MSAVPLRRLLLLFLLFGVLTMPLAWLWLQWGEGVYVRLLWKLLDPLYDSLGLRHQRGGPVAPRLISIVPFVVLMVITPGMRWRRRLVGTLIGLLAIACFHLLLFLLVDSVYVVLGRNRRALAKIVPLLLINDGIPFLVWLFFARDFLRRLVPAFGEPGKGPPSPPAQGPSGRR
ncbi:MAG: hypothetical protein E4H11_07205 [Myxococcales bacterium]|nr:MAG: hypothetical protein E4H11_07205 [Myxococcales bacterium]